MHVNRIGILAFCYLAWINLEDVSITNRKSGFYFFSFFFHYFDWTCHPSFGKSQLKCFEFFF